MLKIAIQKSDKISRGFLDLLAKCGIKIDETQSRLYYKFLELPIELYFVRGLDIPTLLQNKFDVAILGKDSFLEHNLEEITEIKKDLNFAKCRLSFAGRSNDIATIVDLNNKKIATSYTNILSEVLRKNNVNAKIIEMNGSVESAIELQIADVIFDIIQTGSTLIQHGLREYFKEMDLEAVFIAKKNFQSEILDELLFRIHAVISGSDSKYIMFNLEKSRINEIIAILPSQKSPTILELANKNYCAMHTLCSKKEIWQTAKNLQKLGAEDIIVSDVNLRFI